MAQAILQLDGIELRTTDPFVCRALYRLVGTAMSNRDVAELVTAPGDHPTREVAPA